MCLALARWTRPRRDRMLALFGVLLSGLLGGACWVGKAVRLNRGGLLLLERHHSFQVALKVTQTAGGENSTVKKGTLTLRPARHKRTSAVKR